MKRLVTTVTLTTLLVALVLIGLSDSHTTLADTSVPNAEKAATGVNSSATIVITVTMYTVVNE